MIGRISAVLPAVLLAFALAGCSDGDGQPAASPTEANIGSSSTSATTAALPIEGTWRTGPRSRQMVADALTAAGFQQWVTPFLALPGTYGVSDNEAIVLRILNGYWTGYRAVAGGPPQVNDRQTTTVHGDTITIFPVTGGATTTYQWSVVGDQLTLTFVSGTPAPFAGIPDEVFQRAFYTVVPFQRTTP